jgi:hemerythrin-like domain-containing protein
MCDHCSCRQGAIGELMDQHERIGTLGSDVRAAVAADQEGLARANLDRLLAILEPHVVWEESGLFPAVCRHGEFVEHVEGLEAEHASLYAALAAADDDDRGWGVAVAEVLDELDRHIYRENLGLFPAAISVLDAEDWDAIDATRPAGLQRDLHRISTR